MYKKLKLTASSLNVNGAENVWYYSERGSKMRTVPTEHGEATEHFSEQGKTTEFTDAFGNKTKELTTLLGTMKEFTDAFGNTTKECTDAFGNKMCCPRSSHPHGWDDNRNIIRVKRSHMTKRGYLEG